MLLPFSDTSKRNPGSAEDDGHRAALQTASRQLFEGETGPEQETDETNDLHPFNWLVLDSTGGEGEASPTTHAREEQHPPADNSDATKRSKAKETPSVPKQSNQRGERRAKNEHNKPTTRKDKHSAPPRKPTEFEKNYRDDGYWLTGPQHDIFQDYFGDYQTAATVGTTPRESTMTNTNWWTTIAW